MRDENLLLKIARLRRHRRTFGNKPKSPKTFQDFVGLVDKITPGGAAYSSDLKRVFWKTRSGIIFHGPPKDMYEVWVTTAKNPKRGTRLFIEKLRTKRINMITPVDVIDQRTARSLADYAKMKKWVD